MYQHFLDLVANGSSPQPGLPPHGESHTPHCWCALSQPSAWPGCILRSPASCFPPPDWSSGAAGPPVRSGASCSGSQGSCSQPRSAKQHGRGKAGLHLPWTRGPRLHALPGPTASPAQLHWEASRVRVQAVKQQAETWRLISGGREGLHVLWG